MNTEKLIKICTHYRRGGSTTWLLRAAARFPGVIILANNSMMVEYLEKAYPKQYKKVNGLLKRVWRMLFNEETPRKPRFAKYDKNDSGCERRPVLIDLHVLSSQVPGGADKMMVNLTNYIAQNTIHSRHYLAFALVSDPNCIVLTGNDRDACDICDLYRSAYKYRTSRFTKLIHKVFGKTTPLFISLDNDNLLQHHIFSKKVDEIKDRALVLDVSALNC